MNDDPTTTLERPVDRVAAASLRRTAVRGAFLASAILLAAAALRGHLDGWLAAAAVAALALSALPVPLTIDAPARGALRAPKGEQGFATADTLLANIPDPVILIDRRGLVVEANEAARALLPALKTGHPLSFALRSPDVLDGIEQVLRTRQTRRVEYAERVPTERAFEVQIGPSKGGAAEAGIPSGIVLFFRDLTATRRLEHMRVDFVANASHELRTPLASLLGFIETLQGPAREDAAARERFLAIMREQAQRMARLIDDLLSLSRIEMRAHVLPQASVDLAAIVRQMTDTLTPLARGRGVDLVLDVPGEPLQVLGDQDELLRVVENLVENAVKYGEGGRKVEVGLRRLPAGEGRPARIELSVRDHGPGIAPEHLPRLTERFYRVDVAESRQKGGTGLGLAIVKHIVNRHRARLTIESELGRGALFKVTIPEYPAGRFRDPEPRP